MPPRPVQHSALLGLIGLAAASSSAAAFRFNRNRRPALSPSAARPLAGVRLSSSSMVNGGDAREGAAPAGRSHQLPSLASQVRSVNYFVSRKCNYSCKFCFHTAKTSRHLSIPEAERGLRLLREAGTEKINFAGGEPFLHPELLGELVGTCHELGIAVSIISNGSRITREWMEEYGRFVDVLGVSVDSFAPETNLAIGRGDGSGGYVDRIYEVRDMCREHGIIFKMNTVVNAFNWGEDMVDHVSRLAPERWKVFQGECGACGLLVLSCIAMPRRFALV